MLENISVVIFSKVAPEMKDEIIEVALERFLRYGIRNITMMKLVEPLGISTKTVYKYFKSKEELLAECLKVFYTQLYNEFRAILGSNKSPVFIIYSLFRGGFAKDFGVNRTFFHDLNHYYPELQNEAMDSRKSDFNNILMPIMQNGISEGYFRSDLHPEIAFTGVVVLYESITRSDRYDQFEVGPAVLFNNLIEVYLKGMCTEKGLKEIEKMQLVINN